MVNKVRYKIRKFVARMSRHTGVTSRYFAEKYKTDVRTAQLALEKIRLEGKLFKKMIRVNTGIQGSQITGVYYKNE